MASAAKERVRKLLQILWVPAAGDRVLLRRNEKIHRAKIQGGALDFYVTSLIPGEMLNSREMFFVPRQSDYLKLIGRFVEDKIISFTKLEHDGMYQMVRQTTKPNGRPKSIFMVGTPVACLNSVLEMRIHDHELNDYVNRVVLARRKTEDEKFELIPLFN